MRRKQAKQSTVKGQELAPNLPTLSENPDLYNLNAQIQYKIDFIRETIDTSEQELILVGHSIGAKMVMDVMHTDPKIKLGCLMFPTIEHMKDSPAGKRGWIAMHYLPKLITFLAWLLSLLPRHSELFCLFPAHFKPKMSMFLVEIVHISRKISQISR